MRTWKIESRNVSTQSANNVMANLISSIGENHFSTSFINNINSLMPIGCWSIYKVGTSKPIMFESGSYQRFDSTLLSWKEYLAGPHSQDASLCQSTGESPSRLLAHVTSQELTAPGHKEKVYEQFGMTERVSVIEPMRSGGVLALNMYRYADQTSFSESDLAMIELLAEPLFAVVKKHVEFKSKSDSRSASTSQQSIDHFRYGLAKKHSDFSERELDVCARLLNGMSYDGIAADLNLSLSTVKTYRNRAFARLNINFKSELFRIYLDKSRHQPET
jgi:DNA-binding CsgD family transcriptional regulator